MHAEKLSASDFKTVVTMNRKRDRYQDLEQAGFIRLVIGYNAAADLARFILASFCGTLD
jgi:hypothetical protein